MAAWAIGACSTLGAVMATISTASSATSACQSPVPRAKPSSCAALTAKSSLASASISSRGAPVTSNSPETERNAFAWHRPMKPEPTSPIPISGLLICVPSVRLCRCLAPVMGYRVDQVFLGHVIAFEFGHHGPFGHGQNPVTDAQNLGHFRRDHDDGKALFGQIRDQLMDGRFRPHVDATGRFFKDNQLGISAEPFGQNEFLLIAARA